ncbi:MAG TPA: thioredoxin family protein [Nannocystaceae bacterium]|nr:thioredoxin family protein [Nannocystaceae bacterium]
MIRTVAVAFVAALVVAVPACRDAPAESTMAASKGPRSVGYDLRRLRPKNEEKLADMFERLRTQALKEGKHVAVLFSADWCEPCRKLQLELGNMQPEDAIGHVRILELVEEDWEAATRLDEFEGLRARWYDQPASYPVFVVLDDAGGKVEEMKEAIERLEGAGVEPTVANWFRGLSRAG